MSDLISRISLKQSIVVSAILKDKKTLEQIIDEEPSIDAVPVIRCKECKIRYTDRCGMFDVEAEWEWTEDNGFCQYGESKESCTQEQ